MFPSAAHVYEEGRVQLWLTERFFSEKWILLFGFKLRPVHLIDLKW